MSGAPDFRKIAPRQDHGTASAGELHGKMVACCAVKLYFCGLGEFPPQTTSLDALHALSRCDEIFHPARDSRAREVLRLFRLRAPLRSFKTRAAPRILGELKRGKIVGLASRGHPLLQKGPGAELARLCAKAGIACETFGAVSAFDAALARERKTYGIDLKIYSSKIRPI